MVISLRLASLDRWVRAGRGPAFGADPSRHHLLLGPDRDNPTAGDRHQRDSPIAGQRDRQPGPVGPVQPGFPNGGPTDGGRCPGRPDGQGGPRARQDRPVGGPGTPRPDTAQQRQKTDQVSGNSRIHQAQQQINSASDNLAIQSQVKSQAVSSAQAQVASAQAQVTSAQQAVSQTTLTAPANGVVISINGVPGEYVGTGGGTTAEAPGSLA